MDLTEEWNSQFLDDLSSELILGPLLFNPDPQKLTPLVTSQLFPSPLCPRPHLSLLSFLTNSSSDSSIPLSTSASIASYFGPHQNNAVSSSLCHNRLQLLHCPHNNKTILFFPSGINADQVGFVVLSVDDGNLGVCLENGDVFKSNKQLNHPILMLSAKPHCGLVLHEGNDSPSIGYLLACTMYSIHWFSVVVKDIGLESERPSLVYLQSKVFNSCSIVHACWSPHLEEESLVLLETGELFLFDLDSCIRKSFCKGSKLRVNWNNFFTSENHKWLSCEFSFHPRILFVARSDRVFLADLRDGKQNVSCLAKIDMVAAKDGTVEKERFIAFCKAGDDGLHFALASHDLLLLYDVREPLKPLLKWDHNLEKPCYIDVFRLSELRSNSRDDSYDWATKSGFCIVLGSFWNSEFSLFCYGPAPRGSVASKESDVSKFLCKWKLPSQLSLTGCDCFGGNSLVREELFKDSLPEWIGWQRKKETVFGFGILNKDITAQLSEPHEFGGFTLIRLIAPGKLESQRYHASWEFVSSLEEVHKETTLSPEDNFLYLSSGKYKYPKRNKYLKLEYLNGYLNGNLAKVLDFNINKYCTGPQEKDSFSPDFHIILCEKLKACGLGRLRSSPAVVVALNDTSLPTSIREVALRRIWGELPMELLQLAFSCYSEFLEVDIDQKISLEFLVVPDLPQLPPFLLREPSCRSNKWSDQVQPRDVLVGPLLPLPVLLTLHEFRNGSHQEEEASEFQAEAELSVQCNEIVQVASELAVSYHDSGHYDDHAVSLADDEDKVLLGSQKSKPFFMYHPVGSKNFTMDHMQGNSICKDETYSALICKVAEKELVPQARTETVTQELFDELCPINLKFDAHVRNFGPKESQSYGVLIRQFSKWQESFDSYQDFCTRGKFPKQNV